MCNGFNSIILEYDRARQTIFFTIAPRIRGSSSSCRHAHGHANRIFIQQPAMSMSIFLINSKPFKNFKENCVIVWIKRKKS